MGSETILIVEDNPGLRELACVLLEDSGCTVPASSGAEDGLQTANGTQPKIVLSLTDIVMPRVDGRDLASRMISLRPDLKVMCISGCNHDAIPHRGILGQETILVQKPFTKES